MHVVVDMEDLVRLVVLVIVIFNPVDDGLLGIFVLTDVALVAFVSIFVSTAAFSAICVATEVLECSLEVLNFTLDRRIGCAGTVLDHKIVHLRFEFRITQTLVLPSFVGY